MVREHRGRLGLPPVFLPHRQDVAVLLETGADLHVQLLAADQVLPSPSRLERLVAGDTLECRAAGRAGPRSRPRTGPSGWPPRDAGRHPAPERGLRLLASWPPGSWPPPVDLAAARGGPADPSDQRLSIFVTGLLDLLEAVAPPLRGRLHRVLTYLPLGVSQTAAAAVAIIGIALVMLARGVLRGQRRSWLVAVILLAASTVLHLVHGVSVRAIVLSAAVLVLLLVERRYFTATDRPQLAALRRAGAADHRARGDGWPPSSASSSPTCTEGACRPGRSSSAGRHRAPGGALDRGAARPHRRLRLPDACSRSGIAVHRDARSTWSRGPWSTGAWPRTSAPSSAAPPSAGRATSCAATAGARLDYFALRDDKQYFFYGDSLVAYAVFGGVALISPDPIGPEAERTQVWAAFRDYCDAHAWGVGVIGAGEEWLPIYAESGHALPLPGRRGRRRRARPSRSRAAR